jgi:hypothetical protein
MSQSFTGMLDRTAFDGEVGCATDKAMHLETTSAWLGS